MNKKVYVFCIGGTGERVMKSIAMLMATGMDTNGFTIKPIIIDPHLDLAEKKDLQTLIDDYINIRDSMVVGGKSPLGFFGAEMSLLSSASTKTNDTNKSAGENRSFAEFLDIGSLGADSVNNYLVQTLFGRKNLDDKLSEGFRGNPNVGTVVLQERFNGASWLDSFKSECGPDDRVFIISSIFGGTGASGFPLLERIIRNDKSSQILPKIMMGAVTVLPYYSLSDPRVTNSHIDSANFMSKAKSALTYYEHTVKSDMLYYVGEKTLQAEHDNDEKQQNDEANFIELVAATALFDFLRREKPKRQQYFTRAIAEDKASLNLNDAGKGYADVTKCIADVCILRTLLNVLPREKYFPLRQSCGFDAGFYANDMRNISDFVDAFTIWYKQLSAKKRAFAPISDINPASMAGIVDGWQELKAKDDSYYLLEMIKSAKTHSSNKIRDFMEYAYKSIDTYTSNIIKQ